MNLDDKIFVAGGTGLTGQAIIKALIKANYKNIVSSYHSSKNINISNVKYIKLNLLNTEETSSFFKKEKPKYVFLAAAKVGGIVANDTYRADFIYENLQIQNNIINQCYINNVKKLLFLGSSCIYPKLCPQPIKEEYLLTGELEPTNEPYAIAKIAGIKMCESYNAQYKTNFISVMPTNLYGYNDNFDLEKSHVLPALIRKMHLSKLLMQNNIEAIRKDLYIHHDIKASKLNEKELIKWLKGYGIEYKRLSLWGSGEPLREFLYVDDLADALVFLMNSYSVKNSFKNTHINIGTGKDITIKELASFIKKIVKFEGTIVWDKQKPDGTPQKLLDISKINSLGWKAKTDLKTGIKSVYNNYLNKGDKS